MYKQMPVSANEPADGPIDGPSPLLLLEIGSRHSGPGCCQGSFGTKYGTLYIFGTFKFLNFRRRTLLRPKPQFYFFTAFFESMGKI